MLSNAVIVSTRLEVRKIKADNVIFCHYLFHLERIKGESESLLLKMTLVVFFVNFIQSNGRFIKIKHIYKAHDLSNMCAIICVYIQ